MTRFMKKLKKFWMIPLIVVGGLTGVYISLALVGVVFALIATLIVLRAAFNDYVDIFTS